MPTNGELCRLLDWDTAFFGHRIARVIPARLDALTMPQVLAWCAVERIEGLYFLADSDDPETIRQAEDHGFRLVDLRVTLERALDRPPDPPPGVHPFQAEDEPALRAMTRGSYTDARFYVDPHFTREQADALYDTWIVKSCREGYADAVLVAGPPGAPLGYITCDLDGADGSIGLVGVDAAARGQGLARTLVQAALHWFAAHGAARVSVVTQGRNIPAQRVYQRCGFVTQSVQLWYHRWFVHTEDES